MPETHRNSAAFAIEIDRLTKNFTRNHRSSLKNTLLGRGNSSKETFIALKEVNLQIPHGQTLAIIGRNGSGKSTLLGLLARVYRPTSGVIKLLNPLGEPAKVAPLLELGAGFHHELTGNENILFYGALLGMKPKETESKRESIIRFAELEDKIDTVLLTWNEGAKLRLGFSIAIHTDPDILLVDEVLAVGDESFQNKCYRRIAELQTEKKTILFVSHDLGVVERVADRVIWLDKGVIHRDGNVESVLKEYRQVSETS